MRATPLVAAVITGALLTAAAAVAAPLLVYSVSLAAFGLPHVLFEMRYVDARFHDRLGRRYWLGLLALLLTIAALRLLGIGGWSEPLSRARLELLLVLGLIVMVLPVLRLGVPMLLGAITIGALGVGLTRAPLATLVTLAFLHNLTPVGFLAELLEGRPRRIALGLCAIVFVVIPSAIACGGPAWIAGRLGIHAIDLSPFPLGGLRDHLAVFVPETLRERAVAVNLFSAAAYLQCAHYAAVIHVLPRLLRQQCRSGSPATALPWAPAPRFGLGVTLLGTLFLLGFAAAFRDTRAIYGVFAAMHAWIEIPVLLIATSRKALSSADRSPTSAPPSAAAP